MCVANIKEFLCDLCILQIINLDLIVSLMNQDNETPSWLIEQIGLPFSGAVYSIQMKLLAIF